LVAKKRHFNDVKLCRVNYFDVMQRIGIESLAYWAILAMQKPIKMSLGNLNPMNLRITERTVASK
jgi:hypothetical protein